MSDSKLRPIARCRVPNTAQFSAWVCAEVRRLMVSLQADGWTAVEIAESIGVSRRSLYRWRNGDESPEVPRFLALCQLLDDQRAKRGTGT